MVLESLLELVETLRKRIDEHGVALRQSEALTRAALIDPLLRELGWDTENPALVMPEYRLGRGYADYALLKDGKPVIMVEAKKLGNSLQDAASQGIGYCIEDGIGYFAVTDGRIWEIYETHKMAPIAEKLTVQFDITQSPPMTCLKAMALWRPTVEPGIVMMAEMPIVGLDAIKRPAPEPSDLLNPEPEVTEQPALRQMPAAVTQSGETGQEWVAFSDWKITREDDTPVQIRFPDGTLTDVDDGEWNSVLTEPVRWLTKKRILKISDCPIRVKGGQQRLIVASSLTCFNLPQRSYSTEDSPKRVGALYVNLIFESLEYLRHAKRIISEVGGQNLLSQFKVRLR